MPERIRVELVDTSGNEVDINSTFTNLTLTSKFAAKGDMQISFSADDPIYPLIGEDFIFRVFYKYDEEDIPWRNVFNGIHKTFLDSQSTIGRRTFTSYCPDEIEMLDKAKIAYRPGTSGAKKSGASSTVMLEYAKENIGSLATLANGRLVQASNPVSFGPNLVQGFSWSGDRALKGLLDVFQEIRLHSIEKGDQIDFRVTYQDGYSFLVEVGKIAENRTVEGLSSESNGLNAYGNPPVIFSPLRGNLSRMSVSESRYNEANVVIGIGAGSQSSALIHVSQDSESVARSPISQREIVFNAITQKTEDDLIVATDGKLQDSIAKKKINATPRDGSDILFRDYFLGDFVTVEDFSGERFTRQIIEVKLSVSGSGSQSITKDVKLSDE